MKHHMRYEIADILVGILMILLGIFTFIRPDGVMTGFIRLYAVIAIFTGICDIIFFVKSERYTGFLPLLALITGSLSVMCGIALLAFPDSGKWILSLLFPTWFLSHCLFRLVSLPALRNIIGKGRANVSLVINIIGLLFGILMLVRPAVSFLTVSTIIGIYLIVTGIDSISSGISRKKDGQ